MLSFTSNQKTGPILIRHCNTINQEDSGVKQTRALTLHGMAAQADNSRSCIFSVLSIARCCSITQWHELKQTAVWRAGKLMEDAVVASVPQDNCWQSECVIWLRMKTISRAVGVSVTWLCCKLNKHVIRIYCFSAKKNTRIILGLSIHSGFHIQLFEAPINENGHSIWKHMLKGDL